VVVGGGAAGLMAALWAASGPRPVLLLEGSERPGRKILISGGGRCNILPSHAEPDDFVTDGSLHTLAKLLRAWPLDDVRRFFEENLALSLREEEETGKLFPVSNRASEVLDVLLAAVSRRGATVRLGARLVELGREGTAWLVRLASGEHIVASRVVLATGGLSVPATGSDGLGLHIAEALGHSIVPTYPALVPLTSDLPAHGCLAGVSLPVMLTTPLHGGKRSFISRGGFLFTHRGYSGPAILNLSHLAVRGAMIGAPPPIWVQWTDLGGVAWDALLRSKVGPILSLLRGLLPQRLAEQLLAEAGLTGTVGSQLRREDRAHLVEFLTHYALPWAGHEGYRTAEVTGGGIPLNEVDPATLESSLVPGLFFCGEMLDAFGPIGGYNFLWAWVTGKIAGLAAGQS
jgi:predicted Rossmann fold flavoprotein